MPPNHREILSGRRRDLVRKLPWSDALLLALERDGCELTHVRSVAPPSWLIRAKLPVSLRDRFGTAPEILLVVTTGDVQARDLKRAQDEPYRADFRIDLDLMVVVDDAPGLADRLRAMPGRPGQRVPWVADAQGQWPPLQSVLAHGLPAHDLFEERDPVRGGQVLGRADEISTLVRHLRSGDSLGVYGLRKVGKTTLVRAVTDLLDPVGARPERGEQARMGRHLHAVERLVVWLDLEKVYPRDLDTILRRLCDAIRQRLLLAGLNGPSQARDPMVRFDQLVRFAADNTDRPLCLVFDEFDLLFDPSDDAALAGLEPFLGLVRGHAQESRRVSLVFIGRDPGALNAPRMEGRPNPLLAWFVPFWVGPMCAEAANVLLRRLGRRVALDISDDVADTALHWTGGHPLLHRIFGSSVLEVLGRPGATDGAELRETAGRSLEAVAAFKRRADPRDITREVADLLGQRFPGSGELLADLAAAEAHERADLVDLHEAENPGAVDALRDFGLVRDGPEGWRMARFLCHFLPRLPRRRAGP